MFMEQNPVGLIETRIGNKPELQRKINDITTIKDEMTENYDNFDNNDSNYNTKGISSRDH